jgi:CRP-like cAMP-binding protein
MTQQKKGGMFGEMVAFSSMKVWPATVVAETNCTILSLKPEIIINHCQKMCVGHKQLMLNMLELVSNKALGLNRKVNYLSIKSMRGKLSKFLMEEYSKTSKTMFEIEFNRNELSEFLHVSRPSMSRELSRMKEEGIIDYYQATFKLLNIEALSDYASHLN